MRVIGDAVGGGNPVHDKLTRQRFRTVIFGPVEDSAVARGGDVIGKAEIDRTGHHTPGTGNCKDICKKVRRFGAAIETIDGFRLGGKPESHFATANGGLNV